MKKKIILAIVIILSLTGCFSSKKEFRIGAYSSAYIKDTLNGRFWYIYAILKERYPTDARDKDCYIVAEQSNSTPGDYVPIFRIPDSDYEYGDLILGDLSYMFLLKKDTIIRYQMKDGKRTNYNIELKNIEFLGIKKDYIYLKSNNTYYKSDREFKNITEISENELPNKYTFTSIK